MGLRSRLFGSRSKDPYWERFINTAPVDPKNSLIPSIRAAPGGNIFPTKTEVKDPAIMSRDLKELAIFLGATILGIAALETGHIHPDVQQEDGGSETPEELVAKYPYAVVCAVHAEHDPRVALGIGGQLPVQEAGVVSFTLRAYIRELGYTAVLGGARPDAVAVSAGLGDLNRSGRFIAREHKKPLWLGDVVLTDLPLAPYDSKS
jgi:hypothetical protein